MFPLNNRLQRLEHQCYSKPRITYLLKTRLRSSVVHFMCEDRFKSYPISIWWSPPRNGKTSTLNLSNKRAISKLWIKQKRIVKIGQDKKEELNKESANIKKVIAERSKTSQKRCFYPWKLRHPGYASKICAKLLLLVSNYFRLYFD